MLRRPLALMLSLIAAAATSAPAAEPPEIDLPVVRAVLFASGVGCFEHDGEVDGDARLGLAFRTEQINDVLKSLVVLDRDGGTVGSVTYLSDDPIERTLGSFSVKIGDDPALPALLSRLRGAGLAVNVAGQTLTGQILNVESRQKAIGDLPTVVTEHLLSLLTEERRVVRIPLDTIASFELVDAKLRDELNRALAALAGARDTERKAVDILFRGQGRRRVRVGYLLETPVWKTTYRLDLADAEPFLQGWAIVENTSDSDWHSVSLSLVSGRPISFVMNLYTPLYLARPEVRMPLMASLKPRVYEEAIATAEAVPAPAKMARRRGPGGPAVGEINVFADQAAAAAPDEQAEAGVGLAGGGAVAQVAAGSVGELFRYTLEQPVDMPRRRSSMLPIVNRTIKAAKVSIYNQAVQARHPLNGAWLTNDTGLKLLGGPVTVFDGGMYAGDAQIDHLAPGDRRLLSYAVDLSVTVDPAQRAAARITAAKILRGTLMLTRVQRFDQTYAIQSRADQVRRLVVEHPRQEGRRLVEPAECEEKTPDLYRFALTVEPGQTVAFNVQEEEPLTQSIALLDEPIEAFLVYQTSGEISRQVRDALARAIALRQELAALEGRQQELEEQLASIQSGQDRLRQNLASVGGESTLGQRYVAKLNSQEDQIERLEQERQSTREAADVKRTELAEYLRDLNVG